MKCQCSWDSDPYFRIIRAGQAHVEAIERIAGDIYPETRGWPREKLRQHQETFPNGQFVAIESVSGSVVGASLNLIVNWSNYPRRSRYGELVDNGWFGNHAREDGSWLYGAELMVSAGWRGKGIGAALVHARSRLASRLHLAGTRGSARIPGFNATKHGSPENYVAEVKKGAITDPTLTFIIRCGGTLLSVLRNHFDSFQDDCPHAVLSEFRSYNKIDTRILPVRFEEDARL